MNFSQDATNFIRSIKNRGGQIALLRPAGGQIGDCKNCANGWHIFEMIVGGPDPVPQPYERRGMPWSKDKVSITAVYRDGKWYQRCIRMMPCPSCRIRLGPVVSPPPDKGERRNRTLHISELTDKLDGFG